jgi:thiol peroxidase
MEERSGIVTMKGNPLTLVGEELKVGDRAPEAVVLDNGLAPVKISSYRGKVCVIATVPSLDTPVCDMETRRFNEEAGRLGQDVVVLTISMDLPFAQKRWCGAAGIDRVRTLSDYRERSFAPAYGVWVPSKGLMARAVFVVGQDDRLRHVEYVRDVREEPNYKAALDAARAD